MRFDLTPFGVEICDAFSDPRVRAITFEAGSQLFKTRFMLNAIAWAIDQDPGPILYLSGTAEAAADLSLNRLRPMAERDCAPLVRRRYRDKQHWKENELWFDDCIVRLAGGRSVMQVAQHAIRYLLLDELDKFRGAVRSKSGGDHADIESLAERRVKSYRGLERVVKVSTPTTKRGRIHRSYLAGSQGKYVVPCPHCGADLVFEWSQLRWAPCAGAGTSSYGCDVAGLNPAVAARTAVYECPECHGHIEDRHKLDMLRRGRWVHRFPDRTEHRSFHLSSLYSPFLDWPYFVEKYLASHPLDEDGCIVAESRPHPERHQAFVNEDLGEIFEDEVGDPIDEDTIRAHQHIGTVWEYSPGVCPVENPIEVMLYADVQHDCCYYVVRAYGGHETSFLLEYGTVQTLGALADIAATQYRTARGDPVVVRRVAVDSSDGTRVKDVYEACRRHGWTACKNFDTDQQPIPLRVSKRRPPGVRLFLLVTTPIFKHWLRGKLKITAGSPGCWYLHNQVGADYVRHMTCVRLEEDPQTGDRRFVQSHPDDHWHDCEVGQLALAYHYRLRYRQDRVVPSPGVERATVATPEKRDRRRASRGDGPGGWR